MKYKDTEVTLKPALLQLDLEKFGDFFDITEVNKVNIPRRRGTAVRAAISAGWIDSPVWTVEDVDSMAPDFVAWLGDEILKKYLEVTRIDPNS